MACSAGFGSDLELVWNLEIQSEVAPEVSQVKWDSVLEMDVEAYRLSDPVLANLIGPSVIEECHNGPLGRSLSNGTV
jgi:hypothetical protein